MIKQKGMYIILSSPSGAGKTSLAKKIIKKIKILNYLFLIQQDKKGKKK